MNRGTIMALDHTTAVVLTPGGEFVKVRRLPGYEIGAEITYRVRRNAVMLRRWLQGGAGAAVLLALFFGFWLMQPPSVVAYVSMDVNPSVEIGLDEKMNVRKLRAVNPDAEAIVAEVKFKGEALEAVMQALAARLVEAKLLTPHSSDIVIASVPVKSIAAEWESQVTEKMRAVLNEATNPQNNDQAAVEIEVTTISVPPEIRKLANEQGVSSGKMAFWLAAESQGRDVSIDKLKEQSLKKIAEEWGGVDKVLGDDAKHKNDAKAWKERIGQAENKLSASKENKAADDRNSDKKKREDKKREDKKREDKKNEDKKSDDKKSDDKKNDDKNGDINKGRSKDNKGKDNDRKDKEDKKKEDERKEVHDKSDWNKGGNPKNGPKDDDRKSGSKDREEDKREVERKPNPDPDRRRP